MRQVKRSTLLRLMRDNRAHWPGLAWLTALMLLSGFLKSFAAESLGRAVDMGMSARMDDMARSILVTLLMYLGDAIRLGVFNVETARTVERMFLSIKRQVFSAVARCRLADYDGRMSGGDMLSRVTSDLPALTRRFTDSFTWLISVFSRGMIALAFCVSVSWELSAAYVLTLPILLYAMDKIGKPIQALQTEASRSSGRAYGVMHEMLTNNAVIKAFGAERRMSERFGGQIESQRARLDQAAKRGTILTLTAYLSDILLMAIVFLFGGYLIAVGRITVGAFVTFVTLSGSIREAFGLLDKGLSTLREAEALCARVYEVLDLPNEGDQGDQGDGTPLAVHDEAVAARGLNFSYTPGKPVLRDIDITVRHGQHVGVIGPSGCGKTTLMRLICGLYQGYTGELRVCGQPTERVPLGDLRASVAMVSQNPYLFRGTIYENVMYGNPSAPQELLERALRGARLWDFINGLEDGVHTQIGDGGSRLSGGQKQRLAIARALMRDAEIVILDEASSALDTKTEREIQDTMREAFKDKTVIAIAHRFTSIRDMDYVYCMADGRVAEQGGMDELLSRDGMLSRMAAAQGGACDG